MTGLIISRFLPTFPLSLIHMSTKKDSYWIPLADLMTVLMVIFLFMAISYMVVIKKKQASQNKIFEEYEKTKTGLFNELDSTFRKDAQKWNLKLDKDLSIKFTNPQVLFDEGRSDIKPEFKTILAEFLPKYLGVVMQEKYKDKIAEIRIEGHTNTKPINKTSDPYIDNMELSQNRARNVLAFLRNQDCFTTLGNNEQARLQYWLTANGLSFGRTVDAEDSLSFFSGKTIDNDKSRRVEFRIVTTSDEIINQAIKKMKE
ncbi:MAG: OmpA family protein [Chitinophagales bacterium]